MNAKKTDILLIGAGAMSSTLGSMLKQLDPALSVTMIERLGTPFQESQTGGTA
jgi:malate dehydrogenase (quinone)